MKNYSKDQRSYVCVISSQLGEFVFSVSSKWRYDIFTDHSEKTAEIDQLGSLGFHFLLAPFVLAVAIIGSYGHSLTLDKFQGFSFLVILVRTTVFTSKSLASKVERRVAP